MTQIVDIQVSPAPGDSIRSAVFSPVPGYMALLYGKTPGQVRHVSGKKNITVPVDKAWTSLAFRPKSNHCETTEVAVCTGEQSSRVRRFDLDLGFESDRPLELIDLFMPRAHCVAYSPNGRYAALGSTDGLLRVYDLNPDNPLRELPQEVYCTRVGKGCVLALTFNATSNLVFAVCDTHAYMLGPLDASVQVSIYLAQKADLSKPSEREFYCVACHPDYHLAAFAGAGDEVVITDVNQARITYLSTCVGGYIRDLLFLPDRDELAVVGQIGVEVYSLKDRTRVAEWKRKSHELALSACQYGDRVYVART